MRKQNVKDEVITFTSKFTNFEVVNSEFTKCRCYALATGDNANGNDITMEAVDKAIVRGEFYNKPVVAHLYKDEEDGSWRVGGHDSKWVITNTSFEIVDETIPFGVIPESSNIHKEEVLEPDGITTNTYVVMDILLWTGRYNIMDAAYSDDVYFNQSCELSINDYEWKDNDNLAIKDFTFSALCLLNKSDNPEKNVQPCFSSCRVEKIKFSINESKFKKNFELMLEKLKEIESVSDNTAVHNKFNKNECEMKGEFKMTNFKEIQKALTTEDFMSKGEEVKNYKLLSVSDTKVYVLDVDNDYSPIAFDYAIIDDKENNMQIVVIDYESKVGASLSGTDKIEEDGFTEFSIACEINSAKESAIKYFRDNEMPKSLNEMSSNYEEKIKEITEQYNDISQRYENASKDLVRYKEQEDLAKAEEHRSNIVSIFDQYSSKLGKCAEYLIYRSQIEGNEASVTEEEVQNKLTLIMGRYALNLSGKQTFSYKPSSASIKSATGNGNVNGESKYGGLLDKFINK